MIKQVTSSLMCFLGLSLSALADPHETIAGLAHCDAVPTSFLFSITHQGKLDPATFEDPCRSGSGRCNDMFKARFEATRSVTGTAVISRLDGPAGFVSSSYTIDGHALDVPPDGWDRQEPMRYEYVFELSQQHDEGPSRAKTGVEALRYTDRIDGKRKISLQIGDTICENVDFTHQRFFDNK